MAATSWPLRPEVGPEDDEGGNQDEYLIAARPARDLTIRALALESPTERPITGAVFVRDGANIALENLAVRNFRWNGLRVEFTERLTIRRCLVADASRGKRAGGEGGHVRTRWLTDARITANRITSRDGAGYGYKGGGHVRARIDHNVIDVGYFAIESAHENEYGLEIDHNVLTRCISVPKSGPSEDPSARGERYTVWIHDNLLTDSYTVEGPRNHLRLSCNWIRIERPEGRVYTQHGGINHGPVWIDHNVIENVDRSLVWMNEGLAQDVVFAHNTVVCGDAGERAGVLFDSWTAERLDGWIVRNNVIVAPTSQPRALMPTERGVPSKIAADHNLLVRVSAAPAGNVVADAEPAGLFQGQGDKPWTFYAPADATSPLVDAGAPLPAPFWGEAEPTVGRPDIGAIEQGTPPPAWDVPHGP